MACAVRGQSGWSGHHSMNSIALLAMRHRTNRPGRRVSATRCLDQPSVFGDSSLNSALPGPTAFSQPGRSYLQTNEFKNGRGGIGLRDWNDYSRSARLAVCFWTVVRRSDCRFGWWWLIGVVGCAGIARNATASGCGAHLNSNLHCAHYRSRSQLGRRRARSPSRRARPRTYYDHGARVGGGSDLCVSRWRACSVKRKSGAKRDPLSHGTPFHVGGSHC